MNYYTIAPLAYLGQDLSDLTYSSSETLIPGQAVQVPLRQNTVTGIVLGKTSKPSFKSREIEKVLFDKPVLDKIHLELAQWISKYYATSLVVSLQTMLPNGLAKNRRPLKPNKSLIEDNSRPTLTKDQELILRSIRTKADKPHLIYGVTGSGKTEIYMRLIEETINDDRQAIVLVPEISLTPQMLKIFQNRFGDQVVLFHSYLKETERFKNWQAVFDGKANIVLGSRSALFAPVSNLGLIVIDEEHETSYKQDQAPRYHSVRVGGKLAELSNCTLVLGSATPSINSFYSASTGHYYLDILNKRIVQESLPKVTLVDMRNEYKYGNYSIFSEMLGKKISLYLDKKKQILLFINRRGMSTFVNCRDCGYVARCPNCNLSLTFHYKKMDLVCHHCNYREKIPVSCPVCHSLAIKYFGTGTQKVELELKKIVPKECTIGRMDHDTTQKRGSHEVIFNDFADNKVDVLIGTQMITKGWDLANIGLVGIITADTSLNLPDYNASEQTFSLLTQVAGRTGRGHSPGEVILQTYTPDHPAITFAQNHDYLGFYDNEIQNRKSLGYPPFAQLIKLLYNNVSEEKAKVEAKKTFDKLEKRFTDPNIEIIGPSPSFLPKVANKYRWQIIIKQNKINDIEKTNLIESIGLTIDKEWVIDVDPWGII